MRAARTRSGRAGNASPAVFAAGEAGFTAQGDKKEGRVGPVLTAMGVPGGGPDGPLLHLFPMTLSAFYHEGGVR